MGEQAIEKGVNALLKCRRLALELGEALGQAVTDPDGVALEEAQQLVVVVAADAQGGAGLDHAHDQPQHPGHVGAAVHQVADEDRLAPRRRPDCAGRPAVVAGLFGDFVSQKPQQLDQLVEAAVDVADDVEGAAIPTAINGQRPALDDGGLDLLG